MRDPYRWLEDVKAKETEEFVKEQNEITEAYLNSCEYRERINERITELWNFPKYSCPKKHGDKYYYYMNTGLQNQRYNTPSTNKFSKKQPI